MHFSHMSGGGNRERRREQSKIILNLVSSASPQYFTHPPTQLPHILRKAFGHTHTYTHRHTFIHSLTQSPHLCVWCGKCIILSSVQWVRDRWWCAEPNFLKLDGSLHSTKIYIYFSYPRFNSLHFSLFLHSHLDCISHVMLSNNHYPNAYPD